MDAATFANLLRQTTSGKHLPDAIYLHRDGLVFLNEALLDFVKRIAAAIKLTDADWNVVKLSKNSFRISYLLYPYFFEEAYPALQRSYTVDLQQKSVKESRYDISENPPILHRKELMLPTTHPYYEDCCLITQEGEQAGLYENSRLIGFKQSWERIIARHGYTLVDGRLFRQSSVSEASGDPQIDRHRTAIVRHELSAPMKCLAKHGYLNGEFSVFDYGCGRGDDLRELQAHGIEAIGWDPNFRPESDLVPCDLVNLGFVINVIEDRDERMEALIKAYELANKLLVVAAMLATETFIQKFQPFKDGVITSRNTFQKYYSQGELQAFIEQTLDEHAIPIGPGIFYVFKDKLEEQTFLERRQRRHHQWRQLSTRPQPAQAHRVREPKEDLLDTHLELCNAFWQRCLELGRLPLPDEFDRYDELKTTLGSPAKVFRALERRYDTSDFVAAQQSRREDLLVYFALSLFGRRQPYTRLPEPLQRDVKAFFGTYQQGLEEARTLLYSIADSSAISVACEEAHQSLPTSQLLPNKSLTFHKSYLGQCPILLRVYVGCALKLYGELDCVDLIKVHIGSGKCSFMGYDGFETSPIPLLRERIKVKLAEQDVDYFDYMDSFTPTPLYQASQVIRADAPCFEKQKKFDTKLSQILGELRPRTRQQLDEALRVLGYQVQGYQVRKRAQHT